MIDAGELFDSDGSEKSDGFSDGISEGILLGSSDGSDEPVGST
jgi:hypothetical protein